MCVCIAGDNVRAHTIDPPIFKHMSQFCQVLAPEHYTKARKFWLPLKREEVA